MRPSKEEGDANLIAEAFNVHHETGLSPRQLLAQRDELVTELENIANAKQSAFETEDDFRLWAQSRARHAIAKTKQVQG